MKADPITILERGIKEVLPTRQGLSDLMKGRKIRLYLGIDPTSTKLHLGHSIGLRKLQEFADLGHEAILLFGTGTVLAGDPSQRTKARKKIAAEEIEHNITTWKQQAQAIIDFNKVKVMYNAEWLLKLDLKKIIDIASNISAIQLIKRDMFQKRLDRGNTVWTHEILYPLLQGYDSVAMDVDLEIGGTDQTFNMLIGRELMKKMKKKEKYVLTWPLITGTDGNSMSKSSDNCIWLEDSAEEMFGKIMSITDEQIEPYMRLLTDIPVDEIKDSQKNPLEAKTKLASEMVKMYHSQEDAKKARSHFNKTFRDKKPDYKTKIPLVSTATIADVVAPFTTMGSISEAKRLISQGAVDINAGTITNPIHKVKVGDKIKIGATTFGTVVESNK